MTNFKSILYTIITVIVLIASLLLLPVAAVNNISLRVALCGMYMVAVLLFLPPALIVLYFCTYWVVRQKTYLLHRRHPPPRLPRM